MAGMLEGMIGKDEVKTATTAKPLKIKLGGTEQPPASDRVAPKKVEAATDGRKAGIELGSEEDPNAPILVVRVWKGDDPGKFVQVGEGKITVDGLNIEVESMARSELKRLQKILGGKK